MSSAKSIKHIFKIVGIAITGLTLSIVGFSYYQKRQGPRRSIASLRPYLPAHLALDKQAAAMSLEIVGPDAYPDSADESVELVGFVTQHIRSDGALNYKWNLPSGVQLVQGSLSGTLSNLPLGQAQQLSIVVKGFNRDSQKLISLSTQIQKAGSTLSASDVTVSRPEDTMESKVMDIAAQAKAAHADRSANK